MHQYTAITILGWLTGIVLATYSNHPHTVLLIVPILILMRIWRQYQLHLLLLCLTFTIGFVRMQFHLHIPTHESADLVHHHMIVHEQRNTWKQQKVVLIDSLHRQYVAEMPLYPQLTRGMTVTLNATVSLWPQPLSSYHEQLQRKRIIGELHDLAIIERENTISLISVLERARRYFWSHIHAAFPEPIASVVTGMLLGVVGDVDAVTADAFKRSGTSHILVISGWNITIVAALCLVITNALQPSRMVALVFPLIVIALYVMFTGASAAVVRAGVMGSMLVIGRWLDRPRSMLNIIAIAIALITMVDPAALWDMGMQLSTLATLGLIGFATPIQCFLERTILHAPHLSWAREGLASTIAAQITTFPIMVCRLELPTIWSLLANTIITPVVPLAMACGTFFLVATLIHPSLAQVMAWIAYPSFAWIVTGSHVLATWPDIIRMPSIHSAPWIELVMHGCWIVGWAIWQRQTHAATSPHSKI